MKRGEGTHKGLERLRGKFIVFDGIDGAGKGAQLRLLQERLVADGIPLVMARDPGGTAIGDRIRHVLLDYDLSKMDVRCEAFLFMASRAQLTRDVIDPALKENQAVLCDRYVSSTCAYQGAAGYDPKRVIELAHFAIGNTWPQLTIVIDLPIEAGLDRTGRKATPKKQSSDVQGQVRLFADTHVDAMESRPVSFHEKVRQMYLDLPKIYPAPVAIVDGQGSVEEVHARVMETLNSAVL
jgi:dTMP kinase